MEGGCVVLNERGHQPVGAVTRGTTNPNRLRRIDRYLVGPLASVLRDATDPLVVDLGFGATPVTTIELARRIRPLRPDATVIGVEIDPERVAAGRRLLPRGPDLGVSFALGGFELGGEALAPRQPCLVRAANVLRQYDEREVADAWATVCSRLATGGRMIDATCDEIGRVASWITVTEEAVPISLTISLRLSGLERPGVVAARLPKSLIHRNIPGEWIHRLLTSLDDAWARNAPLASFGARQRFRATCQGMRDDGWELLGDASRWRFGEVTFRHP